MEETWFIITWNIEATQLHGPYVSEAVARENAQAMIENNDIEQLGILSAPFLQLK